VSSTDHGQWHLAESNSAFLHGARQRGHDRRQDDALDAGPVDAALSEELGDENADLIGCALTQRLQPPAVREPPTVEHTEHDVGVAYVNGQ
jgi:hypothetical protein